MIAGVVAVGRDVTESVETRDTLATRLRENETLLQEIHHRVKNNMQIMASLLNLQLARLHDSRDKKLVQESSRRIETMARVHEQLYASRDLARVDMQPYVTELVERLVRTYGFEEQEVRTHTDVDDIRLSIERAVPCAQILHEVITNALKHGLRERKSGNLTVAFKYASDNSLVLSVSDDGHGFTAAHTPTSDSLGLKLIELLSKQLDGSHAFTNHCGTTFELRLPLEPCRA
jgi:two-component sensor histidine kinase